MTVERFWRKVHKLPEDGCWEWTGALRGDGMGYGHIGKPLVGERAVHRVSYVLSNGPIGVGKVVCHKCDNPKCVRPDHLFEGTIQDNILDARTKGRLCNRGVRNGRAKLDPEKVAHLRKLREEGWTWKRLGNLFSVTSTAARLAVIGHTWR